MQIIETYLESLFAPYPKTEKFESAKSELREMMEDAYSEALREGATPNEALGSAITNFGNLEELAGTLGISAEVGLSAGARGPAGNKRYPEVSLSEALSYCESREKTRWWMAWAVAGFVVSPVPLILIVGVSGGQGGPDAQNVGIAVGLGLMLILIAAGVGLLLKREGELANFRNISSGRFTSTAPVRNWAKELRAEHSKRRYSALTVSVVLWILAGIPILTLAMTSSLEDTWPSTFGVWGYSVTLILVAFGLLVFLPANWANAAANTLMDDSQHNWLEQAPAIVRALVAAYWPAIVALYLAWSFIGDAWDTSWVIWPIAGVTFGAAMAFMSAFVSRGVAEDPVD